MIIMNKHKNDNVYINNKYVMYVMIIMNKHENNNNDTSTINKMPKYSICMQRGPPLSPYLVWPWAFTAARLPQRRSPTVTVHWQHQRSAEWDRSPWVWLVDGRSMVINLSESWLTWCLLMMINDGDCQWWLMLINDGDQWWLMLIYPR